MVTNKRNIRRSKAAAQRLATRLKTTFQEAATIPESLLAALIVKMKEAGQRVTSDSLRPYLSKAEAGVKNLVQEMARATAEKREIALSYESLLAQMESRLTLEK